MLRRSNLTVLLLFVLAGILLVLKLEQVPSLWYDEGWVLSVARNWVELGHYGHLLMGEPVPATILTIGLPAVAPIALSFRLFGIGVWQSRLPGVFFTVGALGALCYLAGRLYDRSVAVGTLAVALLVVILPSLHPVLVGRQALGEMPALFYLLAGFASFSWARRRPLWPVPLAIVFWALALRTKPQVLPFFVASLSLPLAIALWKRRWRTTRILAFGLLGALAISGVLAWGQQLLLSSRLFSQSSGNDPYTMARSVEQLRTYWFVLVPSVRLATALTFLFSGMPLVLGLCYSAWQYLGSLDETHLDAHQDVGRLILWAFAASWLGWYLLLSIGWSRYLFPPAFVGSVFVAVLLQDLAGGYSYHRLLKRGAGVLKQRRLTVPGMGILLAAVFIPLAFVWAVLGLYFGYAKSSNEPVLETVRFLNTHTAPDALVETIEAELFFLLERPYHHPPEPVRHQLNRRFFLREDNVIRYDPLAEDPDYLVLGRMGRMWGVYERVLPAGAFRLVRTYGPYEIYKRVREQN